MIGDVLVSSILCNNLKMAYPDAEIHYMVHESTVPVLKGNPFIDKIQVFSKESQQSKRGLFKFAHALRDEHYDIIIDAYSKLESWITVLLSNAPRRISFKKPGRTFLYTDNIERKKSAETSLGLTIEHRLALLKPLNLDIEIDPVPKLYVTDEERSFALSLFKEQRVDLTRPTLMIAVTGSEILKTYPAGYMARVIDFIADHYDVNLLFNYNPVLKEKGKKIYTLCKPETKKRIFFDVYGKSLREYIAIMNACDLIVGNDGGAINMAKALDKPSFTIFSPWIPKEVWGTFEDGKLHVSVHLKDFNPKVIRGKKTKDLKKNSLDLYTGLTPDLFYDKLRSFLNINLS
jgi:heptosyltransferase-2